jgi:uncharacterized tellurite resistance protein B-like protein
MTKSNSNNDNPSNLGNIRTESLLDQMKALQQNQKSGKLPKHIDVPLATAMILVEVASSDHTIDRFEKSVIHNSLKSIFRISDESATGLLTKARSALSSMRSSSAEASMLKDILDHNTKRAVANTIDTLIRCNGVVDTMEVYLRNRFRSLLGLPDEPLPPRSDQ